MVGAAGSATAADAPHNKAVRTAAISTSEADGAAAPLYSERGTATCMQCHNQAPVSDILKTPHAVKGDVNSPFGQHGCESCHGPSDAHVSGFAKGKPAEPAVVFNGPKASPVSERNKVCLACHQDAQRMDWVGSAHQNANVACVSCHTIHVAKDPVLVKATQAEKCFSCHAQQRAESFEYSHHPMREGKVVCSDCHNPHGSAGPHLMKEFTVNETCYNCHADKRGPMLWEHQPVRENCLNCHTPHGSNQPRLMKEPMNFLCSSCHSSTSNYSGGGFGGKGSIPGSLQAAHNSALANNRTCVDCHSQVHGSNSPNGTWFFR
ncbi:MAG: DmsE family decaheme c-type cytochrome [Alphaproteobacteria bacterium]|nr:DmsE family decaheme c-type cytochrome [Alphaproteobacteria bacterium]MDE2492450.1 DmsE family decaheme c-type cytochrome [Alphaproteobacteria bacterium]